ncbi:MAG: AMP-binding protein [Clostridia bacterium]|nr:AMP-binding protein [Clostridia bacterium]
MKPLFHDYLDVQGDFISYEDFNKNFRLKKPVSFNFAFDVVDRYGKEDPDRTALVWTDPDGAERVFSFKQMMEASNRAACYFHSLGIRKGDAVMLILKRHHEFWPAIIALHKLGAVTVPATHLLTAKDIVYRVNAADVKMLVCTRQQSDIVTAVEEALPACPGLRHKALVRTRREGWLDYDAGVANQPDVFEKPAGDAFACDDDLMLLYFTSGTTGLPKMVAHNYYYPLGHIITAVYWQQTEDHGLHLTISETGWAKSVWGKLYGQWLGGCAVFAYDFDRFQAADILRVISRYKVTSFCAPPTMYRYILQEPLEQYDLSSLQRCVVAGEPLNPDMAESWSRRMGIELREAFGQTELTVALATFPWMKVCPGSMGKPSPLFEVDLVDEDGQTCPTGVTGEIVCRTHHGPPMGMFMGYHNDPEMTLGVWYNNIYHTGDTAWRDEWGYYWYVGRTDDLIKSAGYRIGPFEVESALLEHPAVLEAAVTGVPDEMRGQLVKATVVLKPGVERSEALIKALQNHVKHMTAPYKYPRIIEFADSLPKTISGKIRRTELRGRDAAKQG